MSTLLLSHHIASAKAAEIERRARESGPPATLIALPAHRDARLPDHVCATVEAAFFSLDVFPDFSRQFFSAVRKAPRLKWLHVFRDGRLAGAYLDVFEKEPLPENSPLWDLPNVLVTPHNAGAAFGNDQRVYEVFLENLGRWQRGEALLNEVIQKT